MGAAQRRRERRLRSWYRHEQQTRTQRTVPEDGQDQGVEARVELYGEAPEAPPPPPTHPPTHTHTPAELFSLYEEDFSGARPDRLTEVRPQERVQRHTVDQIIAAPMLGVPVPLMEKQLLVDVFACYDIQVPEQVIEVPKILIDDISVRTPVCEPQLAEQLVEVPTTFQFRVVVGAVFKVFSQNSPCSSLKFQFRVMEAVVFVEVFKVFSQDRIQQRSLRRSWTFQFLVVKVSSQDRVQQLHPSTLQLTTWMSRLKGFLPLPRPKKSARAAAHSSAELGAHSSSSTLSAHQTAPVPSFDDFEMIEEEAEGEEEVEEEEELEMFDESTDQYEHYSFRPKRLCRHFMAGRCEAWWSCTFAHGEQELHPAALRRADRGRASAADHG